MLAGIFAVVAILVWILEFLGAFHRVGSFSPILWHAHEMIYGYAPAVIAGFVLTASQNWTGIRGVHGSKLKPLVALWILGRLAMSVATRANAIVAIIDLSFYPALAYALFPYLKPSDMKTERVFFLYFALYFGGNLLMHLEAMGILPGYGMRGALLGLNTTILMIIFMGGRVIPFFAESERITAQPVVRPWLDVLAHLSAWGFLISQFVIESSIVTAIVAFVASIIHFARLSGWYVRRVKRIAILWILYIAYFWIVIGFAFSGLAMLGVAPLDSATHAFTIGGLGAMTYGMMSRVALGHTGRPLRPKNWIILGYVLLNFSCLVRVLGPFLFPNQINEWVGVSGAFWITAFLAFVAVYSPMLLSSRVDGRQG